MPAFDVFNFEEHIGHSITFGKTCVVVFTGALKNTLASSKSEAMLKKWLNPKSWKISRTFIDMSMNTNVPPRDVNLG